EIDDQESAHPLRRVVRPRIDVDGQRDDGEPRAEAGRERRQEEEPEARRPAEEPELAAERSEVHVYRVATPAPRRASASARNACAAACAGAATSKARRTLPIAVTTADAAAA